MSEDMVIVGRVAEYGIDMDGQRMDREWLESALESYVARSGNVTEMFQPEKVAGVCEDVDFDSAGPVVTVRLFSDSAKRLAKVGGSGLALSIRNARVTIDDTAPHGVIHGGEVAVSLVDKPMPYPKERDEPTRSS